MSDLPQRQPWPTEPDDRDDHARKADLVLEGGGVKGIGLVGAVNALRETSYSRIQRVAGTSAGAIVASLIAAGMAPAEMQEVMHSLDYKKFEDASLLGRLGLPGKALEILLHGGSFKTDYMHRWVSE